MDVLDPAVPQKSAQSHLATGIAISFGIHLVISAILFGTPQGARSTPPISYIDLKDVQLPSESAAPAPAKPAPPVEKRVEPAKSEVPPPEKAPEPPQPAAQQETPPAVAAQPSAREQVEKTTLGLGMSKGYFSSIGNGETLRGDVKEYYLELLQHINERWWLDQGGDKKGIRSIMVSLIIARNGDIVSIELIESSGNPMYDRAVLTALKAAGPFPPLPVFYSDELFLAPIKLVPPLNLMAG
ncbi:TonB family protein [Geomonas sp. RF6]|uniref:energy transducer TonB n=1 Tax=Geomonas sp. RF6 TaxID=2897342 RepID=UPI001E622C7E|nr:TonB family protein [Geomonas sp. RF6]UFS70825.1 TonB family protein [Geomonas sp. RF6]